MTYDELDRLIYEVGAENDDHLCSHQRCLTRGGKLEEAGDALAEIRRQMQAAQELIAALLPGGLDAHEATGDERTRRAIAAYRAAWAL